MDDTGESVCEEDSKAEKEALNLCSVLTSVIGKLGEIKLPEILSAFLTK